MTANKIAPLVGVFVAGLLVGGGVIYAITRPASAEPTAQESDGGFDPRGAFGGGGATMNFRGDYDSGVGYLTGDVVTFKGSAYVAGDETKDSPPGDPWALLAVQQADTIEGPAGPAGPAGPPGAKGEKGDAGPAGAGAPISGYEVVRSNSISVNANGNTVAQAECPAGKKVLGGGWQSLGYVTSVIAAGPVKVIGTSTDPFNGWSVGLFAGSSPLTVRAYAICANATP